MKFSTEIEKVDTELLHKTAELINNNPFYIFRICVLSVSFFLLYTDFDLVFPFARCHLRHISFLPFTSFLVLYCSFIFHLFYGLLNTTIAKMQRVNLFSIYYLPNHRVPKQHPGRHPSRNTAT